MKKKCFVCMPLIDELKGVFAAIEKTVKECLAGEWKCIKADDTRRPGMVDEKVVKDMLNANLVIAVIADPRETNPINPNVMYELGIAHSFRKPTIVVADSKVKLPFDIQSVETIQIDFSGTLENSIKDLKKHLEESLQDPKVIEELVGRTRPCNPITTHLSGTNIFIEDLPWVMGYCDVLKQERAATTVWEITSDLFWAGEALFFASITEAINKDKKRYFMVENDRAVLGRVENIKNDLQRRGGFTRNKINEHIHFVAIEHEYFVLWPISVVLYDANLPTQKGGIICEPMQPQVGNDYFDRVVRAKFKDHANNLEAFEKSLSELDWTERRKEATFDIGLDGRVVDALADSFANIWNEKILKEADKKTGEERAFLLSKWYIGGMSE